MARSREPSEPARTRRPREDIRRALLVVVVGATLTVLACAIASEREAERDQVQFDRRAAELGGTIARSFLGTREAVLSLPALFESSVKVEQREFSFFVRPALQRHPSLAALEWAPLVRDADRAAFVDRVRHEGYPAFEIREPGPDGEMVRSGTRPVYLPLVYLEPRLEEVRGLEVLFEPGRAVDIWAAIERGTLHVSHRFQLVEDPPGVQSVAVYAPGYDLTRPRRDPAERREALLGLGIALFRLQPLIEGALADQPREGIELALIDPAAPEEVRVLYETAPGTVRRADDAELTHREEFEFGNRRYTVLGVGTAAPTWDQWLVGGLGLGLTVFAAASVLALSTIGRLRRRLEETVELGQYTLEEKIGEGGMGVVYRATHAMLRRPAAIKLLLKKAATEADLARFEREVQLTSRLGHPNTISIFDYGRTADGVFYYVMEFLDGTDLERLVLEHGPLEPGRAIHILAQVCGALAEAHLMGLIHRDIKPANIVLHERLDQPDVVKVVDFGLVKTIDPDPAATGISRLDAITGTPLYLAPEAITAPDTVDGRADLYAVGAVAYYVLTGQRLFDGQNVMAILTRQVGEAPVPPSRRLGRPLPDDLEALVLRCLAKDREQRPATAAELRDALLACRDAAAYDPEEARAWWREHRAHLHEHRPVGPTEGSVTQMAIDLADRPIGDPALSRTRAPGEAARAR